MNYKHKNNSFENVLVFLLFFFIVFILTYSQLIGKHYTKLIDHDTVLIYNSLLLSNNQHIEFLDHPSYTFFLINGLFYKVISFFDNYNLYDIDKIIKNDNFDIYFQNVFTISKYINSFVVLLSLYIFYCILIKLNIKKKFSLFSCLILLLQPSFLKSIFVLRSEIWSLYFFLLCFYFILDYFKSRNIIKIIFSGFFFLLAILSKIQIFINSIFLFLIIPIYLIYKEKDKRLPKFNNIFLFNPVIFLLVLFTFHFYVISNENFKIKMLIDPAFQIIIFFFYFFYLKFLNYKIRDFYLLNNFLSFFFLGIFFGLLIFQLCDYLEIFKFNHRLLLRITYPIYYLSVFVSKQEDLIKMTITTVGNLSFVNILIILGSAITLLRYFYQNYIKSKDFQILFNLSLFITLIIVCFSQIFRYPYFIYITPFAIILFYKISENLHAGKILVFNFLFILLSIGNLYSNSKYISSFFYNDNQISNICSDIPTRKYMKYWHQKFDDTFLDKFCNLKINNY